MKKLYLDCFSGIAGDMALAALIDLGADESYIVRELSRLPIGHFEIGTRSVNKRGITALQLVLNLPHDHHDHHDHHGHHGHPQDQHVHRQAEDILDMIETSDLPVRVKKRSADIFRRIAEAEGKIHGVPAHEVHFHEVGAADSIIDTIGFCLALENLGIDEVIASPVPVGSGTIRIAHGVYPVPAPAVAELLKGVPLAPRHAEGELTTPTGAGILRALASSYGPIPAGTIRAIGYGAGVKDFEHPNIMRAILMETADRTHGETVIVLETQVDDMTGEAAGYAMERLFQAGALDVFFTPIYMKKNRPGILLTVLVLPEDADRCEQTLFRETSTFGVRRSLWERSMLDRKIEKVETPFGTVRVKTALRGGEVVRRSPEYEDLAACARQHDVPLQQVLSVVVSS